MSGVFSNMNLEFDPDMGRYRCRCVSNMYWNDERQEGFDNQFL